MGIRPVKPTIACAGASSDALRSEAGFDMIPGPREQLAGCVWLPRILAKARMLKGGTLAPEYEARFCHPSGVDGHFLAHFGLSREDVVCLAQLQDEAVASWFLARTTPDGIEKWNHVAANLGRPGFPMAERFPVAMSTTYKHLDPRGIETVFEALEADEKAG
jgi:hypothetical protein